VRVYAFVFVCVCVCVCVCVPTRMRRFFRRGNSCYRIAGAKEIEWFGHLKVESNIARASALKGLSQPEVALRYLQFLHNRTRGLKVIFLVRDPTEMAKSSIWRDTSNPLVNTRLHISFLRQVYELTTLRRYYNADSKNSTKGSSIDSYLLDHRTIKSGNLTELFSFLGEEYDKDRIQHVLSIRASFP